MIQLSSPMRVTPPPCTVPRLIVQNSRIVLPKPISSRVGSPEYFARYLKDEIERWGKVIREKGIKPES